MHTNSKADWMAIASRDALGQLNCDALRQLKSISATNQWLVDPGIYYASQ